MVVALGVSVVGEVVESVVSVPGVKSVGGVEDTDESAASIVPESGVEADVEVAAVWSGVVVAVSVGEPEGATVAWSVPGSTGGKPSSVAATSMPSEVKRITSVPPLEGLVPGFGVALTTQSLAESVS